MTTTPPRRIYLSLIVASIASCLAAPQANASVNPFESVGPIRIGMSKQAVGRLIGRSDESSYRRTLPRGVYAEFSYRGAMWTIGFEGPRGDRRVVKIEYSGRKYRTAAGVGIGSRVRAIVREFPNAQCEDRVFGSRGIRYIVVIDPSSKQRVLFHVAYKPVPSPPPGLVVSISVQKRLPYTRAYRRAPCFEGWQDR